MRTIGSLLAGQPALAKQVPANERGPEFWRHRTYCMFHGGDHFFQLVYRLRDSTFVAFAANTPR